MTATRTPWLDPSLPPPPCCFSLLSSPRVGVERGPGGIQQVQDEGQGCTTSTTTTPKQRWYSRSIGRVVRAIQPRYNTVDSGNERDYCLHTVVTLTSNIIIGYVSQVLQVIR